MGVTLNGTINIKLVHDATMYVTGLFSGSASFGTYNISTTNPYDMFLARYDTSGNCIALRTFGQAVGANISISNSGELFCLGAFYNTIQVGSTTLTAVQNPDLYLAKISALTGLGEYHKQSNGKQLSIYANPNHGTFNLDIPDDIKNAKDLRCSITDEHGNLVTDFAVNGTEQSPVYDINHAAKGAYIVKLYTTTSAYYGKVVVE